MREADVVCKEMGYEKALAEQAAHLHQQHDYYLVDSVVCSGSEPALRACGLSISGKCAGKSATVVCSETKQPGNVHIRRLNQEERKKITKLSIKIQLNNNFIIAAGSSLLQNVYLSGVNICC